MYIVLEKDRKIFININRGRERDIERSERKME